MSFNAELLHPIWWWLAHFLLVPLMAWAIWRAQWSRLAHPGDANVLFASILLLWLMWRLAVSISQSPGLEFHLLLVTTVTLMFGWPFAILATALAQAILTMEGQAAWSGYAVNVLNNGVVAVGMTVLTFRLAHWWLPKHFFIYIYFCAFVGGALSMLVSRFLGMLILVTSGAYTLEQLHSQYFSILPIMLFPEAFVNGAIMTLLVVFKPQWVGSFRDDQYLHGK